MISLNWFIHLLDFWQKIYELLGMTDTNPFKIDNAYGYLDSAYSISNLSGGIDTEICFSHYFLVYNRGCKLK